MVQKFVEIDMLVWNTVVHLNTLSQATYAMDTLVALLDKLAFISKYNIV